MKILILIVILFICACNPKFSGEEIDQSIAFCKPHGGILFLMMRDSKELSYLKCNDNSKLLITDLPIK